MLADSFSLTFLVLEIASKYHKMLDFVSLFVLLDTSLFLIRLIFLGQVVHGVLCLTFEISSFPNSSPS